jgi:hypothetical protein
VVQKVLIEESRIAGNIELAMLCEKHSHTLLVLILNIHCQELLLIKSEWNEWQQLVTATVIPEGADDGFDDKFL